MFTVTHTSTRARSAAPQTHVAILSALLLSSGLTPIANAQDEPIDDSGQLSIRTIVEKNERDRSRQFLSQADPGQTTTLIVEKEITVKVPGVQPQAVSCKATVAISYVQLNTIADVDGTIENEDCAASSGSYTVVISIRDENGELNTLEFEEAWLRNDNAPVVFQRDYPIGENVELTRVRPRRVSCVCADPPQK